MPALIDLTGQRYGRLVVVGRTANLGKGSAWATRCDCGAAPTVRSTDLRTGNTQSCGCLRVDVTQKLRYSPNVDYFGAHARVRAARGRAQDNPCTDCAAPAQDWSYDHTDPDELIGTQGTAKGLAFSLDVDRYRPRCKPCHGAFDAPSRKAI